MTMPLALPDHDLPLPTPADLDRLMQCRYAVLVVAGRSGSGLLHAHLDGHRQIAHIPAIWKFHDFLSANFAVLRATPTEFARAFVRFPAHGLLFDTRQSPLAGQLGDGGDLAIQLDRSAFERALLSALGGRLGDPRRLLFASVIAHEWCLGRDVSEAKAVLHHLHHGDWLRPDLLIDSYNLAGMTPPDALRKALQPDIQLVSLRSPLAIVRSYPALTMAVARGPQRVSYYEHLLHLLVQDWLRARVMAGTQIMTAGVRLEDMKADLAGTLAAVCRMLDVSKDDTALARPTFYGHPWIEDGWTALRKQVLASRPDIDTDVCWQDEAFVMGALAGLIDDAYPVEPRYADWNHVLGMMMRAADDPPVTLYPDLQAIPSGRVAATDQVWDRLGFLERFRDLVATRHLGRLPLCRADAVEGVNLSA